MVSFSSESLLALAWACAALATPLIAEPMRSYDLAVLDERSYERGCPSSGYTSKNGMSFTTYCKSNNGGNDAMDRKFFTSPSMEDCMEHCSRYWGKGEGCFGVVWRDTDNLCWIRNSNTSVSGVKDSTDGTHSALIIPKTYEAIDTTCPGTDLSTHTVDGISGMGYTLHCNKVINEFDTCWSGYPKPCWDAQHVDGAFIGYFHAKTLDECVRICVDQSPLCKGVSWNPDYSIGFANCWPKTGYSDNKIITPAKIDGVIHSVTITSLDLPDSKCPDSKTYSTTSNHNFNINCGHANEGTNITQFHMQNITSCMDTCATTDKCVGVVFDTTLQDGFKNCYLKNTTSTISEKANAAFALLSGSNIPSSSATSISPPGSTNSGSSSGSPAPSDTASSSSESKAWIAGPVVGGVVGLAVIAGALLWWRRRKNAGATGEKHNYAEAPAYSPGLGPHGVPAYHHHVSEADPAAARTELPATTKYAHRKGDGVVHEVP